MWLPECGYRPRYHWLPPVGANRQQHRSLRRGLEEHVAACGLAFFCVDGQSVQGVFPSLPYRADPALVTALHGPAGGRPAAPLSPRHTYRVASRSGTGTAKVLLRDPDTSRLVWSQEVGYPGDPWYLDFHKQHDPGGLKLWRVSEERAELDHKAGLHARACPCPGPGACAPFCRAAGCDRGRAGRPDLRRLRCRAARSLVARGAAVAGGPLPGTGAAAHRAADL